MNFYRWKIRFYISSHRRNEPTQMQDIAIWADGEEQARFMFTRLYGGEGYYIDSIEATHVLKSEKLN